MSKRRRRSSSSPDRSFSRSSPKFPREDHLIFSGAYVFCSSKDWEAFYHVRIEDLPADVQDWCNRKGIRNGTLKKADRNRQFTHKFNLDPMELTYYLFAKCEKGKSKLFT